MAFISHQERHKLAKDIYSSSRLKKLFIALNTIFTLCFLAYILVVLFVQVGFIETKKDLDLYHWWMFGESDGRVTQMTWLVIALGVICIICNLIVFIIALQTKSALTISQNTIKLLRSAKPGQGSTGNAAHDAYSRILKNTFLSPEEIRERKLKIKTDKQRIKNEKLLAVAQRKRYLATLKKQAQNEAKNQAKNAAPKKAVAKEKNKKSTKK